MKISTPPPPCDSLILRVFRALAVFFFATAAMTAANAQEAQMQAFRPTSGMVTLTFFSGAGVASTPFSIAGNLSEIVNRISTISPDAYQAFGLQGPGGRSGQRFASNGQVDFSTNPLNPRVIMPGDVVRFLDYLPISPSFDITTRIYTDGGGDLAMAIPVSLASGALTGDEFYIVNGGTFTTTQTPSTENIGYAEPTCDSGMILRTDRLGCRPLQDSDCLAMTGVGGQEVNNGVCECPAGEMENNAGDMCVLDDASCNAMVTGQVSNDGICECPAGSDLNPGGTACVLTDEICEARVSGQRVVGGVCQCPAGERVNGGGDRCELIPTSPTQPITSPVGSGGGVVAERDDGAEMAAYIGGGMLAVGLASYFLWDGNLLAFTFSPDYGYSITESGYAYNVGGRLDFRQDKWHLYYAAGQANANGDFGDLRYESGGEYTADLWTAAFSETVQGETADYRFSLSADYNGGIWQVSPTYRLHSHFADEEFETQNSLNLHGELLWNRWTISPSAGFNWRRPEEFGDNARFNLSAVRRF
ncbi:MAG: hypothetical protein ACR2QC_11450 [Gammaproteobacteria bacterium]